MLINFKDTENNIICVLKDNELWQINSPEFILVYLYSVQSVDKIIL